MARVLCIHPWIVAFYDDALLVDADPLLHNNSIYPCGNAAEWEALKARIRAANRALYT